MNNSLVSLTCALVFILGVLSSKSTASDGMPPYRESNLKLKELYERQQSNPPTDIAALQAQTTHLVNSLRTLLDDRQPLNKPWYGWQGDVLQKQAQVYAACAWLHAWGTFNLLASSEVALRDQNTNEARKGLLWHTDPKLKALQALLQLYGRLGQLHAASEQNILAATIARMTEVNLGSLILDLHPDFLDHWSQAFSSTALIGSDSDSWSRNSNRQSLWSLINLELDTWQDYEWDDKGDILANKFGKQSKLPQWLKALAVDLRKTTGLEGADLALAQPCEKLASYLQFRGRWERNEEILTGPTSATQPDLLRELQAQRASSGSVETIDPKSFISKDLLDAAQPLSDGTVLYEAAIWLRHLLLLSYQKEDLAAVTETTPTFLPTVWTDHLNQYNISGEGFTLRPGASQQPDTAALRWNAWPSANSMTDQLADMNAATYDLLHVRKKYSSPNSEGLRHGSVANKDARARYLGQVVQPLLTHTTSVTDRLVKHTSLLTDGSARKPLKLSATRAEQIRTLADLRALYEEADGQRVSFELLKQAFSSNNVVERGGALQSFSGPMSSGDWNLQAMPNRTFNDYKSQLNKALEELKAAIADGELEISLDQTRLNLREDFQIKQKKLSQAEFFFTAALLGQEAAQKGYAIAEEYKKIHELDVRITELDGKIAEINSKAAEGNLLAKQKQTSYRRQQVDLVQAQVAALELAATQVQKLVKDTEIQLNGFADQLTREAQSIQDSRKRSKIFKIIKTVVNVAGAALAPFTGGASLAITAVVSAGLDTVQKGMATDWRNMGDVIHLLGSAFNEVVQPSLQLAGADLDLAQMTSPQIKDLVTDCNRYFREGKQLTGEAVKLLKAIQSSGAELNQHVAAIAAGFPVKLEDGQLKIAYARSGWVEVTHVGFKQHLDDLLSAKGYLINDAATRLRHYAPLLDAKDSELPVKLAASLSAGIRALPDEFTDGVAATFETKRDQLIEFIKSGQATVEECRSFVSALAGGMIIVKTGAKIVAIPPDVQAQTDKMLARVKSLREKVFTNAITSANAQIQVTVQSIYTAAQNAQSTSNDTQLLNIAQSIPTTTIPELKAQLNTVDLAIREAQGAEEDAASQHIISGYELSSAEYTKEAAELGVTKSQIAMDRMKLQENIVTLELDRNELLQVRATEEVRAWQQGYAIARQELHGAYRACLFQGFNPLLTDGAILTSDEVFSRPDTLTLRGLLGRPSQGRNALLRARSEKVLHALIGPLLWMNITQQATELPEGKYADTLFNDSMLTVNDPKKLLQSVEEQLKKITDVLDQYGNPKVEQFEFTLKAEQATPITEVNQGILKSRRFAMPKGFGKPIATFSVVIGDSLGDLPLTPIAYHNSIEAQRWYALCNEVYVVSTVSTNAPRNLRYVVLPPALTSADPDRATPDALKVAVNGQKAPQPDTVLDPRLISTSDTLESVTTLQSSLNWTAKRHELKGAVGEWQIIIYGDSENLRGMDLKGVIPYLVFDRNL
jgi:hypothetical protein